jgi:microcystin degradation protein MlrC
MRVGIIGLQHESNTFLRAPTTLADFEQGALLTGEAIRHEYGQAFHEVGGFFEGLASEKIEAVPIFFAWALPGGIVEARTLENLLQRMLVALKDAGTVDGLLVAPHGAGVAENAPDMDGAWLREVRSRVGPTMPIVGTLDPHANLSEAMVRTTDFLVAYRTNPHLDQRDRGRDAARVIARMLRHEIRPTQAAAFPRLAINIERQSTANSPCKECYEALDDMLDDRRLLSNSLLLGFPYADVPEMGTSVLVITNDEPELARKLADDFADYLRMRANEFAGQFIEVPAAIEIAVKLPGPVCLLDMGDNVGGGAPGDGTVLIDALCKHQVASAFVCLHDPASVQLATKTGIGATLTMEMGGKTDPRQGTPLAATVRVRGIYDGHFSEHEPRHGGRTEYDMGTTAVVQLLQGPTVMLTSRRIAPFSLEQLRSCNVEPRDFQIIVAKGVHAPAAAYAPVCPTLIRVNTPGVTTADITRLDYRNRRRPMAPFEEI